MSIARISLTLKVLISPVKSFFYQGKKSVTQSVAKILGERTFSAHHCRKLKSQLRRGAIQP